MQLRPTGQKARPAKSDSKAPAKSDSKAEGRPEAKRTEKKSA